MTSTATLQASLDVMKNSEPSIGYSVAYPFGVIGPILCIYFMTRQVQPKFPPKAQRFHMGEITLGDNCAGRTLDDLGKDIPSGIQVTMVRKGHQNIVSSTDLVLASGDGLMIIAEDEAAIAIAATRLGKLEPGRIVKDGSDWTISAYSSGSDMLEFPLRNFRCPRGFHRMCCMSGATTWISCQRPS